MFDDQSTPLLTVNPEYRPFKYLIMMCKCGHRNLRHYLTSQDEEGELWCLECECKEFKEFCEFKEFEFVGASANEKSVSLRTKFSVGLNPTAPPII